ncbi:MAG: hypothetical protein FWD34_00305 [Oscillospiraceae bacterium]|nr:hypothetical protein [Oscillospiraceae bacterium]
MNQIVAGLKKELLYSWRSLRFMAIVLVFLGNALFYPLMCGLMSSLGDMEMADMGAMGDLDAMLAMYRGEQGLYMSMVSFVSFAGLGGIIIMILLSQAAGGEQKKRSIIVPQVAGLSPMGYILPKFILYPPLVFIMTVLSAFLTNAACQLFIKVSYPVEVVWVMGILTGVSLMFTVCLYMFLGISLVQPGLSVIYVVVADTVFSMVIAGFFFVNKYTPWNLTDMAVIAITNHSEERDVFSGIGYSNIAVTVMITLFLCVLLMLGALFSIVAKRTDNTADEVY